MAANLYITLAGTEPKRWNYACAAHLLNRAGFGGTLAEIEQLVGMGPEKAVQSILDYQSHPDTLPPLVFGEFTGPVAPEESMMGPRGGRGGGGRGPLGGRIGLGPRGNPPLGVPMGELSEEQRRTLGNLRQSAERGKMEEMKTWWLDRMVRTQRPLEEKMTLFWHGLFVSSAVSVRNTYNLYQQNQLFRKNAVGNYGNLTLEVSKDAAMLEYLNNDQNKREHPNENYARELMELFTMGIGNYTEQDIKESARAFTGWTHIGEKFVFNEREHDTGNKTFLGRTGNFDGTDIVRIIFQQPATANYLAKRLLKFFAVDEPGNEVIASLAGIIRANNYQVSTTLRALFTSAWFYSPEVMRRQIKSPVQLVVGSLRMLGLNINEPTVVDNSLKMMGQEIFNAPSVKGWDGGRAWINTSTLFSRYNLPAYLVTGSLPNNARRPADPTMRDQFQNFQSSWNPQFDLADAKVSTGDGAVDHYLKRLIQDDVADHKRQELVEFINGTGDARTHLFDPTLPDSDQRVREMVQLIMSLADFQLC